MMPKNTDLWFVHCNYDPPLPLKLERDSSLGARVVGGKTGTHYTGHGETYWDKFREIISLGFVPSEVAKEIKAIGDGWSPPEEKALDERIARGDYKLKK